MPPSGATFAAGQRFDLRVEATGAGPAAPAGLRVTLDGRDITATNILAPGTSGERGHGGTGTAPDASAGRRRRPRPRRRPTSWSAT